MFKEINGNSFWIRLVIFLLISNSVWAQGIIDADEDPMISVPEGYQLYQRETSSDGKFNNYIFRESSEDMYKTSISSLLSEGYNNLDPNLLNKKGYLVRSRTANENEVSEESLTVLEQLLIEAAYMPAQKDLRNKLLSNITSENFNPQKLLAKNSEFKRYFDVLKRNYPNLIDDNGIVNPEEVDKAKEIEARKNEGSPQANEDDQSKIGYKRGEEKSFEEKNVDKPVPFEGCDLRTSPSLMKMFSLKNTMVLWNSKIDDYSTCEGVRMTWYNFPANNKEQCEKLAVGSPHGKYNLKGSSSDKSITRENFIDLCLYALNQRRGQTSDKEILTQVSLPIKSKARFKNSSGDKGGISRQNQR